MSLLPTKLWPFIWHFVKRYKFAFIVFTTTPLLMAFETTVQPYGLKLMIDAMGQSTQSTEGIPPGILLGAGLYLGAWAFAMTVYRLQEWWQTFVIPKVQAEIRMSVIQQLSQQSYGFFINQLSGNISNKVSDLPNSIEQIRLVFSWSIFGTMVMVLAGIILISTVSPLCAALMIFFAIIHVLTSFYVGRNIDRDSIINAEDKSQLNGGIVDMLTNILPVKLFARRGFEINHLKATQEKEIKSNHKMRVTVCFMRMVMDIIIFLMMLGVLSVLVYGWKKGYVGAGDIALVMMSMLAMINQLWYMGQNIMDFFRQIGVAKQALAILATPITISDLPDAKSLEVKQGKIVFDKVAFQYHGQQDLFSNKSLTIEPGSKVGLVGYSGSGKTTFVHLILRFFDVLDGSVLIDDQNIAKVTQDSLHQNIVMVPQDTTLFHRSLKENIAYGMPDATEQQIIQAAKDAHCHEFIAALPEGYETLVGERGVKLSGGQRQRIAIARAMLKPAPILILDEATSALDSVTEQYIQEAMQRIMQNRTTIVVAHRLSTLAAMDRILVFDKGHVIEDGSHDALLAENGHYAHMWRMQAGGFLPS